MKIAFASDGETIESDLSFHFGRCPYYVFVDVKGKEIEKTEAKKNPFFQNHEPGLVPEFIANEKANVIIAGGMGPRAIDWFKKLNVEAITTNPKKIKEVLDDYFLGKLNGADPCDESTH